VFNIFVRRDAANTGTGEQINLQNILDLLEKSIILAIDAWVIHWSSNLIIALEGFNIDRNSQCCTIHYKMLLS